MFIPDKKASSFPRDIPSVAHPRGLRGFGFLNLNNAVDVSNYMKFSKNTFVSVTWLEFVVGSRSFDDLLS
jgi:hypothetical protein